MESDEVIPGYSIGPNVIRPWYMRCPQGDMQVCRDKEQATEQMHEFPVLAVARVNGLVVTVSQNTLVPPYVPPDNASQHDWEQFLYRYGAPGEDRWPEVLKPVASRPCSASHGASCVCEQMVVGWPYPVRLKYRDAVPVFEERMPLGKVGPKGRIQPNKGAAPAGSFQVFEHSA